MSTKPKITADELSRAIFIDYEGNIDRDPTLLGWRIDGRSHAAILEENFETCGDRYRAKDIHSIDHKQLVSEIVSQASNEDRVIISWSEHDLRIINQHLSTKDQNRLSPRYRNAITTARSWHYRALEKRAPAGDLSYFCQLLGYPIPKKYGTGKVGHGLRLIRNQLLEGREYQELTPKARALWVAIVKHNDLDLRSMEFVLRSMLQIPLMKSHPDQMALTFVHESN